MSEVLRNGGGIEKDGQGGADRHGAGCCPCGSIGKDEMHIEEVKG